MLMAKLWHCLCDNHTGGRTLHVPRTGRGRETGGGLGSLLFTCSYLHVSSRDHLILLEGELCVWGGGGCSLPLFRRP